MPALPQHLLDAKLLFNALLPLAFIVMTAGLVSTLSHPADAADRIRTLFGIIVVIAMLSQFDVMLDGSQAYVQHLVTDELHAQPDKVGEQYLNMVTQGRNDKESKGFWSRLLSPHVTLVEGFVAAILWIASLVAACVLYLAYLFEKLVLEAGYGFAPLFFSFLIIPSVRSIGVNYLLSLSGVVLWPLGWAVCSLVTATLINFATNQSFFLADAPSGGLAYAFRNLGAGLLVAIWIIFSTPLAPMVIHKAITTGTQMGTIAGEKIYQKLSNLKNR